MNEVTIDKDDPTKVHFSMIILDNTVSGNNVRVGEHGMQSLAKSVKGMPLVAKLIENEEDRSKDDFGDHEASMGKDREGKDFVERDTIAIGSFTTDGYIVNKEVDGVEVEYLMGDGVLWASRYPDIVNLILSMNEEGIKLNTSSEYRYDEYHFDENKVEIHDGELYFEGIAVLGSDTNYVAPAYESATFTALNQEQQENFNLLVAQALNAEKGEKELDLQKNAISLYRIMDDAKSKIVEHLKGSYEYVWVSDATTEEIIVNAEDSNYDTTYFKFNYTISNDEVIVDLDSQVQVKESREWKIVTNTLEDKVQELDSKLNTLIEEKGALADQLNKANDVISQLNEQIQTVTSEKEELSALNAELLPFKEQVELANKEAKITEVKESFEAKFNAVDGEKEFASEEVQALLINAIEEGEVGLDAKLKLNEKVLELASNKLENSQKDPLGSVLNSNKQRDFNKVITPKESDLLKDLEV